MGKYGKVGRFQRFQIGCIIKAICNSLLPILMLRKLSVLLVIVVLGVSAQIAYANHTWGNYHWARNSNPFTLKVGDNVSIVWDNYLITTTNDWSQSSILDAVVVPGLSTSKTCKPRSGRVEVCNNKYGNNGWLGVAQIWASGDHITQGVTKLNDTYFNTAKYNTPAWRNLVLCQEVGHTLGLDHQDENFSNANLGTCMDYTNDSSTNQHPNVHDYEMLEEIYAHLDAGTTVGQSVMNGNAEVDHNDRSTWGKAIRTGSDGKPSLFVREFAGGKKVFTFVIWAEE